MKQEDRELLLKDLCARLPYGVIVETHDGNGHLNSIDQTIFGVELGINVCSVIRKNYSLEDCKPYLLPLSSMTEEQKREYNRWKHMIPVCRYEYGDVVEEIELYDSPESFEYLIQNHFDYRGLIERGLALDATGKNIY